MAPRALRVPTAPFLLLQLPLSTFVIFGGIDLAIRALYGSAFFESVPWFWLAASAPALALNAGRLLGRVELVEALPDPRTKDVPRPVLELPGGRGGALRSAEVVPRLPVGKRARDGVLFSTGVALLCAAGFLAVVQDSSFDSVLGLKLGGVWYRGTYWNRWWFVFYGFCAAGAASTLTGLTLFLARLNRREE